MNRGWISLPIIALLLGMSVLSMAYQKSQLASYQWLGQLKDVKDERQLWQDFELAFVESPNFASASKSECIGFCALAVQQEKNWQRHSRIMHYQWTRYINSQSKVSYRLCATENQHQYLCWWWRDNKLLANGRVSAFY
jgi:hypothetical protein